MTDNLTGLVWEQKTTETEQSSYTTYSEAASYCEGLSLGNNDDWRVPTRREFSTLMNYSRLSPSLDVTYFPDYTYNGANEVYYWTSSEYHDDPTQMWKVQMSFGIMEAIIAPQAPPHKVRCVSGATEPEADYTDNGNDTVTDNVTGLMWEQKTDDGGSGDKDVTHTWLDALNYCEDLVLGGFSDWRLPNPKELERIIDLSTSDPAIDTATFPNTNNSLYWTGTTCVGCHKFKAFSYDFSDGRLYFGVKKEKDVEVYRENYTRCVRTADSSGTTTTTTPTTTTSTSGTACPTEEIYGSAAPETQLIRNFRDTILTRTPEGQQLIKLYYIWSPFLVQAMREDDTFKGQLKETVDKILQVIDSK